jgi:hypothetical protein
LKKGRGGLSGCTGAREPKFKMKIILTPRAAMSDELFDLTGQVAIVTGTSRGLGQYFAKALAKGRRRSGAHQPHARDSTDFEAEIKALGRRVLSLELDVRNQESIEKMAADAEAAFGQIHILVNNAGCNIRKPALDVHVVRLEPDSRHQPPRYILCCAGRGPAA